MFFNSISVPLAHNQVATSVAQIPHGKRARVAVAETRRGNRPMNAVYTGDHVDFSEKAPQRNFIMPRESFDVAASA